MLFLLLASSSGYAQFNSTEFTRLGIDRGLYQASTYSIAQDKTGFMWLASQDGLQLYDGVSFIEFNHNSTTSGGLSSNSV
ncbi:MAG: hypothetical protein HY965_05455, partial [Ignavibacteriales bacterium]|nr:hypothetical protein [Ignavibacteriales bacterium]